jgi:MFS transporter, AAHS family, 4-hydroxybenzoate transporter
MMFPPRDMRSISTVTAWVRSPYSASVMSSATFRLIMTMIFLSGFLIIGVQLSFNALITGFYPTAIRGTGVGWSQVVGRGGSLIGPLVGGALVSQGIPPAAMFQVSAIAPLLACLALLLFAKLSRRHPSDDPSAARIGPIGNHKQITSA